MNKTVVVGTPEHRKAKCAAIDDIIEGAKSEIADEGVFTPDQIASLERAFRSIALAIRTTV